jgi:hypothetical protein
VNVRRPADHDQVGIGDDLGPGVRHRDDADIEGGLEPGQMASAIRCVLPYMDS